MLAASQTELDSAFCSASERFIIGNKDSDVAVLEKIWRKLTARHYSCI